MRRGRCTLWFGVCIVASSTACSLLFDLGGLTDGASDDGGIGEAGAESGEPAADAGSDVRDGEPDVAPPTTCNTPSTVCAIAAPQGWTGPLFVYDGDPNNVPACPGTTLDAIDANHDIATPIPPAQCSPCSCTTSNVSCNSQVTGYTDNACGTCATPSASMPFGQCVYLNMICASSGFAFVSLKGMSTLAGTCAVDGGAATLPQISWKSSVRGCKAPASAIQQVDCTAGHVCVPQGPPPFGAGPCVFQSGDVACPGVPYVNRTVVYSSTTDSRGCTPCGCTAPPAKCDAGITFYGDADCGTAVYGPFPVGPSCIPSVYGPIYAAVGGLPPTLPCATDGGAPSGTVLPATPTTICCQ